MKKLVFILFIIPMIMIGCVASGEKDNNEITEVKFKDMIDIKELEKLDGKKIKMVGFFAQSSPLDGSMAYLMNMPYQNCAYCLPNTNQLMNTMAVYPKKGKQIEFTDLPVEIIGTIKFENITDQMGYSYNYRIVDAEISLADVDSMSDDVKIYTDLVDRGFPDKIINIILLINNIQSIRVEGENLESVELIPDELVEEVYELFNGLDKDKYIDVLAIVDEVKILVDKVNNSLITKDYDSMDEYIDNEVEIFYKVYEWLMKPQV